MTYRFLKPIVHAHLLKAAREGKFYAVRFDDDGIMDVKEAPNHLVKPSSLVLNEREARFDDRGFRRQIRRERLSWLWEMILDFSQEVDCERFEDDFNENRIVIPIQELPVSLPSVIFELIESRYEHPPQATSGNSRLTFQINALVGRK